MNILFAGGGTMGHIAPSLAVWAALRRQRAEDRGQKAIFVCLESDRQYLANADVTIATIHAPRRSFMLPFKMIVALREAAVILHRERPDIIFSKGGYVSVPICLVAWWKKIPIVLHESDAVSGLANGLIAFLAKRILLGFPGSSHSPKAVCTGNPVRPEVAQGKKDDALRITGCSGNKPIMLVIGGSQGSRALNDAVAANVDALLTLVDIIHITGKEKSTGIKKSGYHETPFAGAELPHFYAAADVALSRAGAGAIAELAANSIPTILVPLRGVAHDHQLRNAALVEKAGGCILLPQEHLAELPTVVAAILSNDDLRARLQKGIRGFASAQSAERVAQEIQKIH